jgi:hypothetical protein
MPECNYTVIIQTFNSKYVWRVEVKPAPSPGTLYKSADALYFMSEESAKRVATAIKHAATLCGAKAPPF